MKELYDSVDIELTSVLYQHKNRLNKASTGTLREIAHELLAMVGIETGDSSFHNDPLKHLRSKRRELTPTVIMMRDRATEKRYDITKRSKRQRESHEDMVEAATSKRRQQGRL